MKDEYSENPDGIVSCGNCENCTNRHHCNAEDDVSDDPLKLLDSF